MSFSFGGGKQDSSSEFSQDVWGPQGDALKDLWAQSGGLLGDQRFNNQLYGRGEMLNDYNDQLMGGMQGGMGNLLGGGSMGNTDELRNQLMSGMARNSSSPSNMSSMYQSIVGGAGNTYIDPMVDAMKRSGMENLDRMQAGTGLDAAAAGQGGSSRHAMQNAMQSKAMNQDMLDREQNLRGMGYDKDLAMKMDIARMADTNQQANFDRQFDMLKQADSNVGAGMGYGQSSQNVGMGSMNPWMAAQQAQWNPYMWQGNLIGDPTVLGSGSGDSSGWNFGMSAGDDQ